MEQRQIPALHLTLHRSEKIPNTYIPKKSWVEMHIQASMNSRGTQYLPWDMILTQARYLARLSQWHERGVFMNLTGKLIG